MKPLLSAIVSLPVLAAATTTYIIYPSPAPPPIAYRQCDTSIVLCCNSLVSDDSTVVTAISELLEFEIEGAILPVGLTCDTIQTVGIFASVWYVCFATYHTVRRAVAELLHL
jgi:hypothetical protein